MKQPPINGLLDFLLFFLIVAQPFLMSLALHFMFPWAALGICLLLEWTAPLWMKQIDLWFFLGVAFAGGLPHMACDPWLFQWERGRSFILGEWIRFFFVFLLTSLPLALVWYLSPPLALAFFFLLTLFHWGTSDSFCIMPSPSHAFWLGLARGGIFLHSILAFHRPEIRTVLSLLPFPMETAWSEVWIKNAPLLVVAFLLIEVIVVASLYQKLQTDEERTLRLHLLESLLLLLLAWQASPLWALSIYFFFFHAWRHLLRVVNLKTRANREPQLPWWSKIFVFYRETAWMSFLTFLAITALSLWLSYAQKTASEWVQVYLVLLSMLTLPHTLFMLWLETENRSTLSPPPMSPGTPPEGEVSPLSLTQVLKHYP